jgi:transcriptional regulator with XRE-family HTH domain
MSSMGKLELLKNIGKNIKTIREHKGLTQVDLVGKIDGDIDTTNISRIESGRTNPTIYTLQRIANALEVELSDLIKIPMDL